MLLDVISLFPYGKAPIAASSDEGHAIDAWQEGFTSPKRLWKPSADTDRGLIHPNNARSASINCRCGESAHQAQSV
jgi:hypothetical protein